ncbi:hypothetical protein HY480_00540 [Candidatus Uhrbacteria bacterium]|nr:hypothetical protein [Candidatus Uhrbacteria bacterium]
MRARFSLHHDPLLASPRIRWIAAGAAVMLAVAWAAILVLPKDLEPDALVTRYTFTFGIGALGGWPNLLELPVIGTILLLVNLTVARLLTRTVDIPPPVTLLLTATLLLEIGIAIGSATLLIVNTRGS